VTPDSWSEQALASPKKHKNSEWNVTKSPRIETAKKKAMYNGSPAKLPLEISVSTNYKEDNCVFFWVKYGKIIIP
jgi:hypothetical protein